MNLKILIVEDKVIYTFTSGRNLLKYTNTYNPESINKILNRFRYLFYNAIEGNVENLSLELKSAASELTATLIPRDLAHELEQAGGTLILEMEEPLFSIPWELLITGNRHLFDQFDISRVLISTEKVTESLISTPANLDIATIIVSDPSENLPSSIEEGTRVLSLLEKIPDISCRLIVNPSKDKASELIRQSRIFHYIGHGDFVDDPGWRFSDGVFTDADIKNLAIHSKLPSFVFSNSCPPRKSENYSKLYSIPLSFIKGGCGVFIGSHWDLKDAEATEFSYSFYTELARGKSVASAFQSAKNQLRITSRSDSIAWATYFITGDAELCLVQNTYDSNDFISHRGDLPAKKGYDNIQNKLRYYDQLWVEESKSNKFLRKYSGYALLLFILVGSFVIFMHFYSRNLPLRVVVDKPQNILEQNRKIDFIGLHPKHQLHEVMLEKTELCFIRHLTSLHKGKLFDRREANEPESDSYFRVSGKLVTEGDQSRILIIVHRTKDRAVLYADDFVLNPSDEFPCLKLADWFKKNYGF
ncbi:CHAT domain-containing protein [Myxococcota bacterium]|nr:CHAT domain-containing protein [Myxococcota bacterium]MBU1381595.1 CHAT domain-containing protein [Myxococcota bacterium]MBU1496861.1 CHAT domain-containing protein [Myxococcota bacterium]